MAVVTFYGPLSDIMGRTRIVDIGAKAVSIRSILARLEEEEPALRETLARLRVSIAMNNQMTSPDAMATETDDIAILPPFSGG